MMVYLVVPSVVAGLDVVACVLGRVVVACCMGLVAAGGYSAKGGREKESEEQDREAAGCTA